MTTQGNATPANVDGGSKLSIVWLVPVIALVIGLWMVYTHWASQGPLISITFQNAEGIEAGKTKVKMKNVEVGAVLEVKLSDNAEHVVLSVRIEKDAKHLLRSDTNFWVVRPRVGKGGITGLGTLLSGAYIELSPGSQAQAAFGFEGLETPPVTPVGTPGLHITLESDSNQALTEGDPVLFHGTEVGTIEYVHFNSAERRNYYNVFIAEPFDALITSNTHFWFSSGITLNVSADGVRVELASLATLIAGGVSFDVPKGQPRGELITERAFFTIYPREDAIYEKQYKHALTYAILFDDSIRGLKPGAAVEYRGIKVGRVLRADIDFPEIQNLLDPASRIPVLIEVVPARLGFADTEAALPKLRQRIDALIADGLRGGLATGSLLTGQKYVELQYHEGVPGEPQTFAKYRVIPAINGQFGQLLESVEDTLDTINKLPLGEIAQGARDAIDEATGTLSELRKSATELEGIMANPASHQLVGNLNATLFSFQKLAGDFSEGSLTHQELRQTLSSLEEVLKQLQPVLGTLRRKPNSLIFGSSVDEDLEPKGVKQ
ncbi:MAG: intermembrane transport protein PqiB [Halioglobus sp.]